MLCLVVSLYYLINVCSVKGIRCHSHWFFLISNYYLSFVVIRRHLSSFKSLVVIRGLSKSAMSIPAVHQSSDPAVLQTSNLAVQQSIKSSNPEILQSSSPVMQQMPIQQSSSLAIQHSSSSGVQQSSYRAKQQSSTLNNLAIQQSSSPAVQQCSSPAVQQSSNLAIQLACWSFVIMRCRAMSFFIIVGDLGRFLLGPRGDSLSFLLIRCRSLPIVVIRGHAVPYVVMRCDSAEEADLFNEWRHLSWVSDLPYGWACAHPPS